MNTRQQRIYDFLSTNKAGVLASVDPDGGPHAAVVYYTIDQSDFSISFLTKTETKKYDNLIRHNHVVFVVFDQATQTVAQIFGNAIEIKDHLEVNKIAQAVSDVSLETTNNSIIPIAKLEAGDYTAFKIEPNQIRMAIYSHPQSGEYKHLFDTLESFELKTDY